MDWKAFILSLLQWIEAQGPEAVLWTLLLQALFVILVIPGPFFTMAAGFLFGMWGGLAVAVVGTMLGAAAAYGIGRGFFPAARTRPAARSRWVLVMEQFIRGGGWKIVLSTRLIPLFPFKLSNYFFGWTRFSFRDFLIGTFLGIIPMTAVSVAAGSLASDMAALLKPGENGLGKQWPWSVAGLVAALLLCIYAGYQGRRKMKDMDLRTNEAAADPIADTGAQAPLEASQAKDPIKERETLEGAE